MNWKRIPIRVLIVAAVVYAGVALSNPTTAFACHRTNIDFPADGQNFSVPLPFDLTPRYDTTEWAHFYYLDLYFGVPYNAEIKNGHSQAGFNCVDERNAQNTDIITENGDYFYVLYRSNQTDFAAWRNYWATGAPAPFPGTFPTEYVVSKFSVNKQFEQDPVIIIPGILGSSDKDGVWMIDPIFHTYDDLVETLEANGYEKGKDLFTMPYDWRQSNVLTALQLRDRINEVQAICQCGKVDLVAHSMGGLAARQYIQSDKYENDVDQLIFLGTPHLGAPYSYLMWEAGEIGTKTGNTGERLRDWFMKFVLSREAQKARFASLFDYVKNKPISSVQELLPIYNYLRDKSTGNLRTYPDNYPRNAFLEDLKGGVVNLLNRSRVTNIVGNLDAGSTLNIIRVVPSSFLPLWEHGYPDGFDGSTTNHGFEFGLGDGTVPKNSGEFIISDLNEISTGHNAMVTNAEGLIFKKLTGKDATTLVDRGFSINPKLLMIKILSPVDVVVVAPDGKRVGKNLQTGEEINEIEGAFYSGFLTDNEFVTIPNPLDGEYTIEVQGTAAGPYTVAVGYISNEFFVENEFTAPIMPDLTVELDLSVDNENPEALELKPADLVPPDIEILSPKPRDYFRSEILPIDVNIADAESGIFSSEVKFDDRIVNTGDGIDLFFEKLGGHAVNVSASDFANNAAFSEVSFRVIATAASTISDIERAFSLGWIRNHGVKNSLVRKVGNGAFGAFLNELEAQRGKHLNEGAYQLLKEDINWLLNN